jgi:hypothetical protein
MPKLARFLLPPPPLQSFYLPFKRRLSPNKRAGFFPKSCCFTLLLLFFCGVLGAQVPAETVAAELDVLLASREVSYAQAARFILEAAEILPADPAGTAAESAFALALEKGWIPKNAAPQAPARLEDVSLLVMGSFNLKGGLMYSLFRSPHFAYREMVYQQLLQGRNDPALHLSGERLLRIIGRVLSQTGEAGGDEDGLAGTEEWDGTGEWDGK